MPVSAPLSRGIFATSFLELPADVTTKRSPRCSTRLRARAVRPPARSPARGRRGRRAPTTPRSASRSAPPPAASGTLHVHRQRDRQPDQGRRRPGDPEHEPDARPARDDVARGSRELAVSHPWPVRSTRSSSSVATFSRARPGGRRRGHRARPRRAAAADRARRRPAGDRAGEAPRHRDQHRGRAAHHRRADARHHEDGGRGPAQHRSRARRCAATACRRSAVGRERRHRARNGGRPRVVSGAGDRRSTSVWSATSTASTSRCSMRSTGATARAGDRVPGRRHRAAASYNINADIVANQLAGALARGRAGRLHRVGGVLRDKDDPTTRLRA